MQVVVGFEVWYSGESLVNMPIGLMVWSRRMVVGSEGSGEGCLRGRRVDTMSVGMVGDSGGFRRGLGGWR